MLPLRTACRYMKSKSHKYHYCIMEIDTYGIRIEGYDPYYSEKSNEGNDLYGKTPDELLKALIKKGWIIEEDDLDSILVDEIFANMNSNQVIHIYDDCSGYIEEDKNFNNSNKLMEILHGK